MCNTPGQSCILHGVVRDPCVIRLWAICLVLSLLLAGCGGGNSAAPTATSSAAPPPGGGAPAPLNTPNPINVSAGANVSGVDIAVGAPSGTNPNAQVLGTAPLGESGGSAQNTGDQVHRGSSVHVLLFGPGLSGNMQVRLSGPSDYSISNQQTITSTQNTPGIEFDISVGSSAALGGRTVILTDANNNVTTFTGGLEVIP